eukprot:TRINITY_DN6540_c0_g1_i1.p1 TRINITY_DN6540_c0_g1~~TRINITY_DN6540_c0_g1_i1.p1  ORF type:complete len:384 (+),score=78.18 TRINITY_DN6540_c0_g1_i1:66-1217(+)
MDLSDMDEEELLLKAKNSLISRDYDITCDCYEYLCIMYKHSLNLEIKKFYLYQYGLSLKRIYKYKEAVEVFTERLEIMPNDSLTHWLRCICYSYSGRPLEALEDCNIAIDIGPAEDYYYTFKGKINKCLGNYEIAKTDYEKALELLNNKMNSKYSYVNDIHDLDNGVKVDYAFTCYDLSEVKYQLKDFQGSLQDINSAIDILNLNIHKYIFYRSKIYYKLDRLDKCLEDINLAHNTPKSDLAEYHYCLGLWNYKNKLYHEAIENFTKSIVERPNYTRNLTKRSRCYYKLGLLYNAIDDLKSLQKENPYSYKNNELFSRYEKELTVFEWLESLNQTDHFHIFIEEGLDEMEIIKDLTLDDLKDISINNEEDQNILINAVNQLEI